MNTLPSTPAGSSLSGSWASMEVSRHYLARRSILAHSHKEQGKDTLPAWVEKSIIEQARGHNLSMGDFRGINASVMGLGGTTSAGRPIEPAPMLSTLRSKGRAGSCEGGLMMAPEPRRPLTATFRRAEPLTYGQLRRTGQAPGRAANFQSISTAENRNARPFSGDWRRPGMPVRLGQLDSICGDAAKGSVTRLERFGASPKALRFTLDRRADFLEAIC